MKNYDYIIFGGGMAGSAAVMGIRKNDKAGSIAVFTEEPYPPYNRPPLSKGLWGKMQIKNIMRPLEKYDVDLFLKSKVMSIFSEEFKIEVENGEKYGYAKLLMATGGSPNQIPDIPNDVITFKTLDDYKRLRALVEMNDRFCVVGGGFIGSEITASLIQQNKNVDLIFPEIGIASQIFPDHMSLFLNRYYETKGVKVHSQRYVEGINKQGETFVVQVRDIITKEIELFKYDSVVLGLGIKPNIQLAKNAGLVIEDGIVVNEFLQTSRPNIYAAGDVANFYHAGLQKRFRAEHEDNANQMGMTAGLNMAGDQIPYTHFPFFYSDLFDLGYEAVGECSKMHRTIEDWIEPYKQGIIYYLDDKQIKGIVFWNLWGNTDQGRTIISTGKEYSDGDLIGLIR